MRNNNSIEFICLGSGSSGNAYVFRKNNECVLVECGFDYSKLVEMLINTGINIDEIKAVLVTHKHSDHAKSLSKFIDLGIPTYAPASALIDEQMHRINVHVIHDHDKFAIVGWLSVYCFSTFHDVESYGFAFLDNETKESILFINDTKMFDFELKDIKFDYVFIECNHIRKQLEVIMDRSLLNGNAGEVFKYKRQAGYHLSLSACKKFLSRMNLKNTKGIFLMHLSKECCNDVVVKTEINTVFNIPTFVCYARGGIN